MFSPYLKKFSETTQQREKFQQMQQADHKKHRGSIYFPP